MPFADSSRPVNSGVRRLHSCQSKKVDMMDWQTVITSVASSTAIAAGIAYFLKKSFDETLSLYFERIKESNKALIQEEMRRRAFLFDRQFEMLKVMLSLIYSLRNAERTLWNKISSVPNNNFILDTEHSQLAMNISKYSAELSDVLEKERALIPKGLFDMAHEAKHISLAISPLVDLLSADVLTDRRKEAYESLKRKHCELEGHYMSLVNEVQGFIGVVETGDAA